ncbi:hypothetical protein LAZ67_4002750 [Cordylochernes scorpioides]|uniref:Integrase catalytic domain-containing protein n=1 Tax=Cordylochernes scorpioides TaxID=51811 RepID=A0ABY6KD69_9ARAC|nr:hypothetical protein LAZ67_4002750 [Cordylochernes scorpioides]
MAESSMNIQKFDGNNFTSWKFRIICILEGKDLDGFIKEDPPKDEKITVEWKRRDAQAREVITCAMDDTQDENAAYNMGHKFNKNLKKNSSDSNRERKPKCFICQKFGHKAAVCWFNPVNKSKENNQGNSIQTIPKQTFSKNKQYTSRASLIGENHNQETAMNLSSPEFSNKCKWILDSGATSHMSKDINLMDDLQDDSRKITLPDDRFIKSNGIGTVEIYQDDYHLLTLKEVLYVPELNNNLISFTRLPFNEIDSKQSTKPIDLIHMDLIGPFQHESIDRAIYVLNIVDDFSRKILPKFLKSKLETFAKLKEFIDIIENIKGTKIKRIRSDNGGKFTNRQLSSYLIEKGIEHQFTTFYSPSQNGIVERANRSLIEGTRALLIESQLPPKFWAEAMNTYSYIKNRTPHKRNDKTTPEELFTGKKPTIKHLKVFGCRAEYWIPKFKRYKFEKITKSGIFVGYSNKKKAFRICDPKNYAITETRDVSFIEKEKGAELLSNEVKAELPDQVLIDLNFCHKNGQKEEEPIPIHHGNVPESTSDEPDEDKNVYNLRPNPQQGFYYESSLSDEDTSQDDTTSDPTYHPGDSVMKPKGFEYQEEGWWLSWGDYCRELLCRMGVGLWKWILRQGRTGANKWPYFIEKHTFDPRVHRTATIHRATCWLPFSPAAVSISRVLRPYGIKVLYNSPPNLATILRHHITKSDKPTLPINSTGAVYSIQCLDCPTSYVGETGRTTGIRISEHRRNIRNKDPKSLIFTHIAQTGHREDAWCQMHPKETWTPVKISAQANSPQSFEVATPLGKMLIRYQQFIRPKDGVNEKRQLSLEPIPGSPEAQHLHYDSPTMGESSTTPIQRSSEEININQKENATASAGISPEPSGRPRCHDGQGVILQVMPEDPALQTKIKEADMVSRGNQLLSQNFNISEAWTNSWISSDIPNKNLITSPSVKIPGFSLPRREWVLLNRFRTGQGRTSSGGPVTGLRTHRRCRTPELRQDVLDGEGRAGPAARQRQHCAPRRHIAGEKTN